MGTVLPFELTLRAKYDDKLTEADENAAWNVHTYRVQFARTGDSNVAGLPDWPKYTEQNDALMDFTAAAPVANLTREGTNWTW